MKHCLTYSREIFLSYHISYIRTGNQLTKCNMDDNKIIKAKEIKLITVFVQNMRYFAFSMFKYSMTESSQCRKNHYC